MLLLARRMADIDRLLPPQSEIWRRNVALGVVSMMEFRHGGRSTAGAGFEREDGSFGGWILNVDAPLERQKGKIFNKSP